MFAIGAIGGRSTPEGASEASPNETGRSDDDHALTAIPHGQSAMGPNSEKHIFAEIVQKVISVFQDTWKSNTDSGTQAFSLLSQRVLKSH